MECTLGTLHALIACFGWSNFYLDGGLSYQNAEFPHLEWRTHVIRSPSVIETITSLEQVDEPYNPYGRAALGYEMRFKSITLSAEAFYAGSVAGDGGPATKGVSLKARWYPFKH
jgi:hypothetical protein